MSGPVVSSKWLARRITGTGARDVSAGVANLIDSGELPSGTRLPTIRSLAAELDAKVSSVTGAWVYLRREGLVETRRRGGTLVRGRQSAGQGAAAAPFAGWAAVEMIQALPDIALVPDTAPVFAASVDPGRPLGQALMIDPVLHSRLEEEWPYQAGSFAVLPSGHAALLMTLRATRAAGATAVAAETPGLLRSSTIITGLTDERFAVEGDSEGPLPESLDRALGAGARVLVYQPSGRVPTGSCLTPRRRDVLADVLRAHGGRTWIVEEDASSGLFDAASLGTLFPERTIRISQFWRALGADVAVIAVGGPAPIVDRIREEQRAGGVRVSGLLQSVLARLLSDAGMARKVVFAGRVYTRRHDMLAAGITSRGVQVHSHGGLFVWIPVADELRAVADLAALGVRVQAGSRAYLDPPADPHIRVATTRLPDDSGLLDDLAAVIAGAASGRALVDAE